MSAYVDGALHGRKRSRLERELEASPEIAEQIDHSRALGRLVREAWTEGPAAPSPDFLLAAIRPALAEIDRERRARPAWLRALDAAIARFGATLRPSPALGMAAAAAFLLAVALIPRVHPAPGLLDTNVLGPVRAPQAAAAAASAAATAQRSAAPLDPLFRDADLSEGLGSVYDVSPVGRPAVLFHSPDGSVTLWVIDDGDLSYRLGATARWG